MDFDHHERHQTLKTIRHLDETDKLRQLPKGFLSEGWGNPWQNDSGKECIRLLPQVLTNPSLRVARPTVMVVDSLYCNLLPENTVAFASKLADGIEQTVGAVNLANVWNKLAAALLADEEVGAQSTFGAHNIKEAVALLQSGGPRHGLFRALNLGWRRAVRQRASYQAFPDHGKYQHDPWNIRDTHSPSSETCQAQVARLVSLRKRDFMVVDALAAEHAKQANYMCHRFSAPVLWQTVPGREHWDNAMLNTRDTLNYMSDRHALGAAFWALYASAVHNNSSWRTADHKRVEGSAQAYALHELAVSHAVRKCAESVNFGADPLVPRTFEVLATPVFQDEYRRMYGIIADRFLKTLFPLLSLDPPSANLNEG